jgi:hypothetical protein
MGQDNFTNSQPELGLVMDIDDGDNFDLTC